MIKANVYIYGSLILVTIFGIFGQGISYLMNENIVKISPIYYLTVLTVTSVFLYLVTALFTYGSIKRKIIKKDKFAVYLLAISFIGVPTSLWSLFVLAMWWG